MPIWVKKLMASILEAISSQSVQNKIISFLRNNVIEAFIVSVLKLSGFKYWIVGLLADKIIDESDEHIIEPLFREMGYQSDVLKGAVIYKKVKNAEDLNAWLDSVRDV